jgi:hypothetical protein
MRASVEKTEANLLSGDYAQLQAGISDLFWAATYYSAPGGGGRYVPSAPITLNRNSVPEPLRATVVERVYRPPAGSGGRPFVRRAVMAWTVVPENRHDLQRLLVMFSSDSLSEVKRPRADVARVGALASRYHRNGFVLSIDPGSRIPWFGTEGTLRIRDGERTGICPYSAPFASGASAIVELQDTAMKVACEARSYSVEMLAFVERGDPESRDLGSMLTKPRRETLRTLPAQVPGTRIVVQCTGSIAPEEPLPCFDYFSFWRDDDQFAPSLGVDLAAMKERENDVLRQVIDSGSGPDYRIQRGGYSVPVSYSIRTAGGDLVRHVDKVYIRSDELANRILSDFPWRQGSRVRVIAPYGSLEAGHSPYSMVVMDAEFLRFQPGG